MRSVTFSKVVTLLKVTLLQLKVYSIFFKTASFSARYTHVGTRYTPGPVASGSPGSKDKFTPTFSIVRGSFDNASLTLREGSYRCCFLFFSLEYCFEYCIVSIGHKPILSVALVVHQWKFASLCFPLYFAVI